MREFATPQTSPVDERARVHDDLLRVAGATPGAVLYLVRGDNGWSEVTARAFHADVRRAAALLGGSGVGPGDRVVLWGRASYGWAVADLALSYLGAVSVAVFDTAEAGTVAGHVAGTGAVAVLVDDPARLADLVDVPATDEQPGPDGGAAHPPGPRRWHWAGADLVPVPTAGEGVPTPLDDDALDARRDAVDAGDVATIIFTSGTTGSPKGCVLTHRQLCASVHGQAAEFSALTGPDAATVIALPLAHVFARTVQLVALRTGTPVAHVPDVRRLVEDLAELRPTFVLGVPRLFERIVTTVSQRATADGRGRRFDAAVRVAIDVSRAREAGEVPLWLRARHAFHDRTVLSGVREAVGGRLTWAISGGAPLGERLTRFLDGAGITVLEGYGLTETAAAVTANVPGDVRIGTVGRPLPGVRVRVAADGELLVAAPQVFSGYWDDDEATHEVLDDQGWLHTGDLAEIGREGHVRVIGRRREILVLASGKQVSPEPFEAQLRQHPLVDQCLVVGDGRPYLGVLITLDKPAVTAWARERGLPTRRRQLTDDPRLREVLQQAVDEANDEFAPAQAVRRFTVVPVTWTEESGQLTASQKLRRTRISQAHGREVEALFAP